MTDPRHVVTKLLAAVNAHDLDALSDCFATDFVNETPAHPSRSFTGGAQVRRNWSAIFAGVPDLRAEVVADEVLRAARFYLEPVDSSDTDVSSAVAHSIGAHEAAAPS